jgi:hypothetical protein
MCTALKRWRPLCAVVACSAVLLACTQAGTLRAGEFLGCDCGDTCCDTCCGDGGCGGACGGCGNERLWIGAEYLLWNIDGTYLPALVTTSPASTPLASAGELGQSTTTIVSGNETIGDDWRGGWRLYGGVYLDDCHNWAIIGDYFKLGDDDYYYRSPANPDGYVMRPFYNAQTDSQDAEQVAVPNQLSGTVTVNASDSFEGAGIALQRCLWQTCDPCGCCPSTQVVGIGGYRYYNYDSQLTITEDLLVLPNTQQPLVPGTTILVQDQFTAKNEFHGGEIGMQLRHNRSWWWWDGMAKIAIGGMRRTVIVNGQTVNTVPNVGTTTNEGGLLTSEITNIGKYTDSKAAVIPHFRLGLGAQLTEMLSVHAGYNVILWDEVARAADHLPPGLEVDPRNLPPIVAGGGPEPVFPGIQGSSLVAQGFDFGLELTY